MANPKRKQSKRRSANRRAANAFIAPEFAKDPTDGTLFVGLLGGVILIVGGLTFFPALAVGPIVEHFAMLLGQTF